jgi:autotransporter passenger strand-loop-strand repeat protein
MTTIVVSGSTTSTVSTHIPSGTSYVVLAGGTLDVVSGGIVSGLVTISLGGTEHISSGGLVLNTSIGGGSAFGAGLQFIFSGGTASSVVLQDGSNDPSFQFVSSGGLAVNTVLSAGDELVFAGGTASGTTVANRRGLQVLSGSTAVSTSVLTNATQTCSPAVSRYVGEFQRQGRQQRQCGDRRSGGAQWRQRPNLPAARPRSARHRLRRADDARLCGER